MSRNKLLSLFATIAFLFAVLSCISLAADRSAVSYPVTVNYDISVEKLVELGHYSWTSKSVNSSNFHSKKHGRAEVQTELISLNRMVSSDGALMELADRGYRHATLHELLAFGVKYPDVQLHFPVVAIGSVCEVHGNRYVAYLYRDDLGRYLFLYWFEYSWVGSVRFLAVRK